MGNGITQVTAAAGYNVTMVPSCTNSLRLRNSISHTRRILCVHLSKVEGGRPSWRGSARVCLHAPAMR